MDRTSSSSRDETGSHDSKDGDSKWRPPLERQMSFRRDDPVPVMTRSDKLTVAAFCFSNLAVGAFYSLLGPFFPNEAAKKGASSTVVGLIFGVYELVFVIISPIFGIYITKIGAKFMFIAGIMVCGYCSILFGFLDASPAGSTFIVLCFVVRCMEGLGAAALMTASYAIMAFTFPDRVATMFGALELFTGLGLMIGPPIGGWLYQVGGFKMPFMASGALLLVVGVLCVFLLPNAEGSTKREGSMLHLLSSPAVLLSGLLLICGASNIGFVDIGLSPVLTDKFGLSPFLTGLIFLVGPGVYAVTSPIWGIVADKIPNYSIWLIIVGYILSGFSFWLLGPAPFIPFPSYELWMVIVSQIFMGLGVGTMVAGFQLLTQAAREKNMPETIGTYGLISGAFTSFFSFGAFVGPVVGGALIDGLGFPWAATIIGSFTALSAILALIYAIWRQCFRERPSGGSSVDEKTALLSST